MCVCVCVCVCVCEVYGELSISYLIGVRVETRMCDVAKDV